MYIKCILITIIGKNFIIYASVKLIFINSPNKVGNLHGCLDCYVK